MKTCQCISLQLKYTHIFEEGMNQGAMAKSLGMDESSGLVSIKLGFMKKREIDNFKNGYELGTKYINDWSKGKKLLCLAIQCGDVKPSDFKRSFCLNSGRHYYEEI